MAFIDSSELRIAGIVWQTFGGEFATNASASWPKVSDQMTGQIDLGGSNSASRLA
jgi:hypothetical protein